MKWTQSLDFQQASLRANENTVSRSTNFTISVLSPFFSKQVAFAYSTQIFVFIWYAKPNRARDEAEENQIKVNFVKITLKQSAELLIVILNVAKALYYF